MDFDFEYVTTKYSWVIDPTVRSVIAIAITWIVLMVVGRVFDNVEPRIPLPRMMFLMIRRLLRFAILLLAISVILPFWGFDLNTVLTMIGGAMAMVAIGFVAVWSLLSNLLCAFVLTAFRPFRIGDEVELVPENIKGKVVDLSLLFTSLRTEEGDYYRVPNNLFFQKIFRCRPGKSTIELADQLLQDKPVE